jgi:hypothetical protein
MLNPIRLKPYSANRHRSCERYLASIMNGPALQQALGFAGGTDRAWGAVNEPSGMIEMRMRKNDCSRRNGVKPPKPICPAIYHDPGVLVLNQQCTMASVPARTYFDLAARTEEGDFKHGVFCCHHLPKSTILARYRSLPARSQEFCSPVAPKFPMPATAGTA